MSGKKRHLIPTKQIHNSQGFALGFSTTGWFFSNDPLAQIVFRLLFDAFRTMQSSASDLP